MLKVYFTHKHLFCWIGLLLLELFPAIAQAERNVVRVYNYTWYAPTGFGGMVLQNAAYESWQLYTDPNATAVAAGGIWYAPAVFDTGNYTTIEKVEVYLGVYPGYSYGTPGQIAWSNFLDKLRRTVRILDAPSAQNQNLVTACDRTAGGFRGKCSAKPPMMVYSAHETAVSLRVEDSPLTYVPAFGPAPAVTVFYTDAGSVAPAGSGSLGLDWSCSLFSWIEDNPLSASADLRLQARGGGVETYSGYNSAAQKFTANRWANAEVIRTGAASYERRFSDGTVETFAQSDGAASGVRRIFLSEIRDAWGNACTFTYSGSKLVSVTDATGKISSLVYDSLVPTRLIKVVDPFLREAVLGYDASGRLISCTDPAQTLSSVAYGGDGKISSMTTPYGTSSFARGTTGTTRWLEMTDPRGAKERVEYRYEQPALVAGPSGYALPSTHWAARDISDLTTSPDLAAYAAQGYNMEPSVIDIGPWNGAWNRRMASFDGTTGRGGVTYFWDKKATGTSQTQTSAAYQTGLAFSKLGVSGQAAWTKAPLEAKVVSVYKGETESGKAETAQAISSYRAVGGLKLQHSQATYGDLGVLTKAIDPVGRTLEYSYNPAEKADLLEVRNKTGVLNELIGTYGDYLHHQPRTIVDAAGQTTSIVYNLRGQVETVTNAKSEVTKSFYEETATVPAYGQLKKVTQAFGTALAADTQWACDAYGRVQTVTDAEGYVVTLSYDTIGGNALRTLDRVVRTTFPDATYEEARYDDARWPLDMAHRRDRLGRETAYEYDSLQNLVKITDPLLHTTQFVQCPCGATDKIIDGNGIQTEWDRDLQKRIIGKKIAGQTVATYIYEPDTGRLKTVTDALGQVVTYGYASDDQLATVTYMNAIKPTANVTFTYDPNWNRLASMTAGAEQTLYGYHPIATGDGILGDGRLASIDGPWAGDTISYSYDALGRMTGRQINGVANASTVTYDAAGRLENVTNPLGSFGHYYVNAVSGRLDHVTYPNGQQTNFAWLANPQDRRLQEIKHLKPGGAQQLSKFNYEYDVTGQIAKWTQWHDGLNGAQRYELVNDVAQQLKDAVLKDVTSGSTLKSYGYSYDAGGNRTNVTEDGVGMAEVPNSFNQLTASNAIAGMMRFKGTVSEPATMTLAGQPVTVTGLKWSAVMAVSAGANHLALTATETTNVPSGLNAQTTTKNLDFTLSAALGRTSSYDLNGNMTSNAGIQSYEWDAANRLVAITYTGTTKRTELTYDGLSRCVKLIEKTGATVTSDKRFLWEGTSRLEERDASNVVTKRFFGEGVQMGGASYYCTRDHLGSQRELTDSTGVLHARYDYTPWGERAKVAGDLEVDTGFTGHYQHLPSGLALAPYRAYAADMGRWLSRDPIGEEGGTNLYGYVLNDPMGLVDPLGLDVTGTFSIGSGNLSFADNQRTVDRRGFFDRLFGGPPRTQALSFSCNAGSGTNNIADMDQVAVGPLPTGNYAIYERPGTIAGRVAYILDPIDSNRYNDAWNGRADGLGRGAFRLHTSVPGAVRNGSDGCVVVGANTLGNLHRFLQGTQMGDRQTIGGFTGRYVGTLNVTP